MTTKELRRLLSNTPVSPGSILRYELDARGMSENDLSAQVGCEFSDVSGVVRGDLAVTSEFALKLGVGAWDSCTDMAQSAGEVRSDAGT